MTDGGHRPRGRRWWKYLLWFTLSGLLLLAGMAWYATTESFQLMVRRRLVAELERVTGGRVELDGVHTVPFRFLVDVRGLTIHGREAANEVPYLHVDRLLAYVKVISVLSTEFGFSSIVIEHPTIHVIVYPDGLTNQPQPRVPEESRKNPVEPLFAISIRRLEVQHGEMLWNERRVPLDFAANDISAEMAYSFLRAHYHGKLSLGKIDTQVQNYRPFAWTTEAHFALSRNKIEITSLKAASGRSHLEAAGAIEDFRQPQIHADYSLSLDLGEAAAIARRRDLRAGIMDVVASGAWSLEKFSSSGKLQLKDFTWQDDELLLRPAALNAQFSLDPQRLTLTQIQARLWGGVVTGDADLANWLGTPTRAGKGKKQPEQQGTVRLRLKNVSVAALTEAVFSPHRALSQIKLAGLANGTINTKWQGSVRKADAELNMDVAAAPRLAPAEMPVAAHVRGIYHAANDELEVAQFDASTRASELRASGRLSSTASLNLSASSSDLHEWQAVISALGGPSPLPVVVHGRVTFEGTAAGKFSDVSLTGNVQAENFDSLIPATVLRPEHEVHWDSLSAALHVSSHNFAARNAILRHGNAHLGFDFSASLQKGDFLPDSPFTLHLDVRDAEVSELQALAGYHYPVTGRMSMVLQASGTRAQPHGDGHLQLSEATLYGEPVQQFTSDVHVTPAEQQLNNIQLTHYGGQVTGGIAFSPSTQAFHFSLAGSNFDLSRIPKLQASRVAIDGRLNFTARGSGTLDAPVVSANVHLIDLAFDHERAGDFTFDATTQGAELLLAGHSQFEHADLAINGSVQMRQDWPADLAMHFNHLDVDSLLHSYLRERITGHSAVAGDFRLRGPLRYPDHFEITGNLSDLYADVENIKLHNQGPVRFSVSHQLLNLEQIHLVGDDTDFSANGTVQLTGERALDLRAQGSVNLQLIQSLNPDFTSSGVVNVSMTVSGNIAHPLAQGQLQLTNGAIAYIDLPSALSGVNGTLHFNQDRMEIETLSAHTGGGLLTLGGDVTSYSHQLNFNLTVHAQGVRLRYPPGLSSTADADLRLSGTSSNSTLSGDVAISKLSLTPGLDFGAYLERTKQSTVLPQTNSYLNRVRLDVHLVTTPELQMQTAVAKLSGDADLHLRGTVARPSVLGRVDILEGEVYFNGTKYRLERGDVTFSSPVSITPVLDLEATTHVRDYDISLGINGTPEKLNVTYRSEPPLPSSDIIALLALGRTREESATLQSSSSAFNSEASNAILGEALNATLSNRAQRLFGVSRIKIDPQGLSTETNPARGPQVTIEQQVANDLTLTYSTNVSQTSQQIIQLEYNITRNVSIIGVRDQNGVVSFDIRIRQRKK